MKAILEKTSYNKNKNSKKSLLFSMDNNLDPKQISSHSTYLTDFLHLKNAFLISYFPLQEELKLILRKLNPSRCALANEINTRLIIQEGGIFFRSDIIVTIGEGEVWISHDEVKNQEKLFKLFLGYLKQKLQNTQAPLIINVSQELNKLNDEKESKKNENIFHDP